MDAVSVIDMPTLRRDDGARNEADKFQLKSVSDVTVFDGDQSG